MAAAVSVRPELAVSLRSKVKAVKQNFTALIC